MKASRDVLLRRVAALVINTPFTLHEVAEAVATEVARRAAPPAPRRHGGVRKGSKILNRRAPHQERIVAFLAAQGGATVNQVLAATCAPSTQTVDSQLRSLQRKGKAFRGMSPTGRDVRWFATADAAAAYTERLKAERDACVPAAKPSTRRDLILALIAARPGLSREELAAELSLSTGQITCHMKFLCSAGSNRRRVYTAVVRGLPTRYFIDQAAAAQAVADGRLTIRPPKPPKVPKVKVPKPPKAPKPKKVPKPPKAKREPKPGSQLVLAAKPKKQAAVESMAGPVITPAGLVVQRCPTPLGRFEVAANAPLTGGFSTSRPGINPFTGKAWA